MKPDKVKNFIILGELSLDGKIRHVAGILPIAIETRNRDFDGLIIPLSNADEGAIVGGVNIYPFENLTEVVNFLNGELDVVPHTVEEEEIFRTEREYLLDFRM